MVPIIHARKQSAASPESLTSVVASAPETIDTLLARIRANESIPAKRRADICSAVQTLCKVLGFQPESTSAEARVFAPHFVQLTPARAGLSPRRLQNCKSLLDAALAYAVPSHPRHNRDKISPSYRRLLNRAPKKWDVLALLRFFGFATRCKVEPENVNDQVFDLFLQDLENHCLKESRRIDLDARKTWNRMAAVVPGWPQTNVTIPRYGDYWALPYSAFPETLEAEADAYLESRQPKSICALDDLLNEEELFGEGGVDRKRALPLSEKTSHLVRYRIRQFASALVIRKLMKPEQITNLAVLVKPATVVEGLKFFIERNKGELRNSQIHGLANDLLMIAKLFVGSSEADIKKLTSICRKVSPIHDGLPESARRSLGPFRDTDNVQVFLGLAKKVVAEIEKTKTIDRVIANRFAAALWIKIAQRAPLRISDLMTINIEKDILRSHHGKNAAVALLVTTQKTGKVLEVPLPAETVRILDLYLLKYRKALIDAPCPWLFPRPDGKHKSAKTMSADIQRLMRDHIGFAINPHSFRHVAAKLYLTAHPGHYTDVQIMLGHKSLKTTTQYYCELEAEEVFKYFDAVLLKLESAPILGGRK